MSNELINHIKQLNEARRAKGGCMFIVEDPEHWAGYGVTTIAEYERYMLVCNVFELTREVYGYKPSWSGLMQQSDEQLRAEEEVLFRELKEHNEREDVFNKEQLELEAKLCKEHGVDTETLVRWGVIEAYTPWRSSEKWYLLEMELQSDRH